MNGDRNLLCFCEFGRLTEECTFNGLRGIIFLDFSSRSGNRLLPRFCEDLSLRLFNFFGDSYKIASGDN